MTTVNALKLELANSNDIEAGVDGHIVWDEYGMIIGTFATKADAVDALFNHIYVI